MRAGHYENRKESVDIMIRSSREIIEDLIGFGRECLIRPGRGSDQRMPGSKQHSVSRHGVSNGGRQQNNDRRHSAPNNGKHSAPNGKRPASRPAQSKPNQGKKTGWTKPKKKK